MSKHRKPIKNDGRKEDIKLKKILLTTAKLQCLKIILDIIFEVYNQFK